MFLFETWTEMLKFIFKSQSYKPGFVQRFYSLLTPNHGEYQYFRALIIQCQSLLKEINTHGNEKNFLLQSPHLRSSRQPEGRWTRGIGIQASVMAFPIYSKNGFQEHSSMWDVVDSTRVLLDSGIRRQRFHERQGKGPGSLPGFWFCHKLPRGLGWVSPGLLSLSLMIPLL